MSATVYAGAVAPESYTLDVTPGSSGVDLSTVTAASFKVLKSDGSTATWTATRSNQTATTLTLAYQFSAGGADVSVAGVYSIYASLTIPAGTVRTRPRTLYVNGTYETGGA